MTVAKRPIGRPRRFSKFESFEAALPPQMVKRPAYCDGIGIFKGSTSTTVWVKIRMPRGGTYRGRTIPAGGSVEHKLGKRSSWEWHELVAERDRLQKLADHGEPLEPVELPLFAKYATDWLDERKPTLRSYGVTRGNILKALNPTFGRKALNAITVADVNRWISKQSADLKPASVQRQLNTFNAIMNHAIRNGLIDQNPSEKCPPIKGIEPRLRFVTEKDWQQILATTEAIELEQEEKKEQTPHQIRGWLRHYVAWAYNSGMRRGEILNLTWDQIRVLGKDHTVVEVINTKTGKPRFVTCTPQMETILAELAELDRAPGDTRLFPISMTTLKRTLAKLWKKTGLTDVRLHDLRRTHATMLLQRNIDPRTVAGRLGHSGTSMLSKHYAVDLGDMQAAKAFGRPVANDDEGEEEAEAVSFAAEGQKQAVDS